MDLDFLKEVGESLKGTGIDTPEEFEKALVARVKALRLRVTDLDIQYERGVATVMGMVADQATREKVILAVGNVKGVARVKDSLAVGMTGAQQAELRRAAVHKSAAKTAEAKVVAAHAAEKARKEAQAKYERQQRRMAFKKELAARRQAVESSKTAFHKVVKGESLRKISKKYYGSESHWKAIFDANQPMIKKADLIYPGQVLRIPRV